MTLTHGSALPGSLYPVSGRASSTVLLETLPALPQSMPIYTCALQALCERLVHVIYLGPQVYWGRLGPLFWKLLICAGSSLSFPSALGQAIRALSHTFRVVSACSEGP